MSGPDAHMGMRTEQALLGALMLDPDAYWRILSHVADDDFAKPEHRLIYRAIRNLQNGDGGCDSVTVSEWLAREGEIEAAGGMTYVMGLHNNAPSSANVVAYAKSVRDQAKQRRAVLCLKNALTRIEQGEPHDEVVGSVFAGLETDAAGDASTSVGQAVDLALAAARRAAELRATGKILGVSSTLPSLNRLTGGFHGSRLVVLGGRPGTYKSALVWQILCRAGANGIPVGMISLEMDAAELGARALANALMLNGQDLALGNREALEAAQNDAGKLRGWPIYLDFTADSVGRTTARILEWKHRHDVQLVVLDHLQLIARGRGTKRYEDLGEFSRAMKQLAMRIATPILLVSQLSREVERDGRRPRLSDLRESGDIEQNADIVLFAHRDQSGDRDRYELLLAKQRGGPANRVIDLWVEGEQFRLGELDEAGTAVAV